VLARNVLGSHAEESFDRLTRLSATLLRAPVAFVSLVDGERLVFKSAVGLPERGASHGETSLAHAACKDILASRAPLVVGDTRQSDVLRDNAAVLALGLVAFAGTPLEVEGKPVGALCVADRVPRQWTEGELQLLHEFARLVEAQVTLGLANEALRERERVLDAVLATIPVGVAQRDMDGTVIRANPALARTFGRTNAELLSMNLWEITHPSDLPHDWAARADLLEGRESVIAYAKRMRHAAGHYVWVRYSAAVLRDADGASLGTVAAFEDITSERQALESIARQAQVHSTIARSIPRTAILLFDRDMRYVVADGADLLSTIGLAKADLEGQSALDVALPENRDVIEKGFGAVLKGDDAELEFRRAGRTLLARLAPVWESERVTGGIAAIQDVTEEREHQMLARRAKALFEVTIANVRDGVAVFDSSDRILYANLALAELFNMHQQSMIGLPRVELLRHVSTLAEDPGDFLSRLGERQPVPGVIECTLVKPRRRQLRRTLSSLALPDGPGFLATWQDITAEADLLAERERLALTDALTGIPNRRAAEQALAKDKAGAERAHTPLCVAFFDIDHFKRVNDLHGHGAGDEVLRRVAATLDQGKRLTDTVARWGGEEFVAVLPVGIEGAVAFCERARAAVENIETPGVGRVTISAGVAELVGAEQTSDLLGRADRCLYAAKAAGRNRVHTER